MQCESCLKRPATIVVKFSDGEGFLVCETCRPEDDSLCKPYDGPRSVARSIA